MPRAGSFLPRFGALALAVAAACAAPRISSTGSKLPLATQAAGEGASIQLQYEPGNELEARRIGDSLVAARPRVVRWGTFVRPVTVRILPSHDDLETELGRHGYPWLRAWTYSDGEQILVQSPRTWGDQTDLSELIAHELTHSLMYQLLGPAGGGYAEEPPLWFSEGMASVTAGQGHVRLTIADLRAWQLQHPGADLLHADGELYRNEKEAVYGAAHHTFEILVAVAGDRGVRDLIRGVRQGSPFSEAFAAATGRALAAFEKDAVRAGFSAEAFPRTRTAAAPGL
jgi:hypothetical protein